MGGLGHILESEGIPTTQISLVREHTEQIRPPRALWVPFELGRPFGAPQEAAFQTRVLRDALTLLEHTGSAVLRDFPEDAPDTVATEEDDGWACPLAFPDAPTERSLGQAFIAEIEAMRAWHETATRDRGHSTYGISGLSVEEASAFLVQALEGPCDPPKGSDPSFAGMIKLATEDVKALYLEAASAQPSRRRANARELADWFWGETQAGRVQLELRNVFATSEDPAIKLLAQVLIVPGEQVHRAG